MDENVRRGYDITMKHLNLKNLCMILLGNTIYALAIVMFILPNNMITGGTTGLGIAIHHYFGLPIHSFVLLFNTLMFLLGAAVLGMKFALTTLVSTFYYPVILGVLEQMPALQNVTDDRTWKRSAETFRLCTEFFKDDISTPADAGNSAGTDLQKLPYYQP